MNKLLYKRIVILIVAISTTLIACKKGNDEDSFNEQYIVKIEVVNREVEEVQIDNFTRNITIKMFENQEKLDVKLKITLVDGVSVIGHDKNEVTIDLRNPASLVLKRQSKEVKFKLIGIDVVKPINEDTMFKNWTPSTSFGELPDGIRVYKSPTKLQGKNAVAYIAVADLSKSRNFHVLGEARGYKTPTQFYEETQKTYSVIVNAGFFWDGASLSMIYRDGKLIAPNGQVINRSNGVQSVPFYPTRGVFSQSSSNSYRTDWVFTTVIPGTTYAYPFPSANKTGTTPQPVPSATYPANAWEFQAKTAIGGGPILIKDGKYQNTWVEELYDEPSGIGPVSNNPRTAIGITASRRIILFVCEGRNMTPGVPGFTLEETANILLDLGCVEAMNLDGGGSSYMLVNGLETIKPSDGKQRSIVTAVGLK